MFVCLCIYIWLPSTLAYVTEIQRWYFKNPMLQLLSFYLQHENFLPDLSRNIKSNDLTFTCLPLLPIPWWRCWHVLKGPKVDARKEKTINRWGEYVQGDTGLSKSPWWHEMRRFPSELIKRMKHRLFSQELCFVAFETMQKLSWDWKLDSSTGPNGVSFHWEGGVLCNWCTGYV